MHGLGVALASVIGKHWALSVVHAEQVGAAVWDETTCLWNLESGGRHQKKRVLVELEW